MDRSVLCGSGPLHYIAEALWTFTLADIACQAEGNSYYYSEIGFLWFVIGPTIEPWGTPHIPSLVFKPSTRAMDLLVFCLHFVSMSNICSSS